MRGRGLVVLTGCGHSGIVNILRYARKLTGEDPLHAVVGGFHLSGPLFEPVIPPTCDALADLAPDYLVPTHCTAGAPSTRSPPGSRTRSSRTASERASSSASEEAASVGLYSPAMAGGTLVRELAAGALVDATFAVSRKERRTRRDGRPFLDLELTDKSGRVRARVWDGVPVLEQRFEVGDTVRVLGRVGEYAGKVELEVRDVERVDPGDPAEFVPGARRDIEDLDGYIDFLVGEIYHDGLRALCEAVLGEPGYRERFRTAPATENGHHSYAGGLAEHTVAVAALCRETAQLHPRLNADLLTAAALLHDCGCVDAFVTGAVILPSERGALLGHVHLGLARIERAGARARIDESALQPLLGIVASHHGAPEGRRFPSPEAVALHAANALDSRVNDAL